MHGQVCAGGLLDDAAGGDADLFAGDAAVGADAQSPCIGTINLTACPGHAYRALVREHRHVTRIAAGNLSAIPNGHCGWASTSHMTVRAGGLNGELALPG